MVMSERETPASEKSEPVVPTAPVEEEKAKAGTKNDLDRDLGDDGEKSAVSNKDADGDKDEDADKVAESDKESEGEGEVVLVPPGNPLRWVRGGVTAGAGILLAFLVMANQGQLRWGVPLGTIFLAVAAWGIMDLLGTFDDADKDDAGVSRLVASRTLASLSRPLLQLGGTFVLFCATLAGAQDGLQFGLAENVSQYLWGVIVTAVFLALVASVYKLGVALGPWAKDETGLARPLLKREGFWVILAGTLL